MRRMHGSSGEDNTSISTPATSDTTCDIVTEMDAPTIQPKFLPKLNQLGLIAVGFSGGQVC